MVGSRAAREHAARTRPVFQFHGHGAANLAPLAGRDGTGRQTPVPSSARYLIIWVGRSTRRPSSTRSDQDNGASCQIPELDRMLLTARDRRVPRWRLGRVDQCPLDPADDPFLRCIQDQRMRSVWRSLWALSLCRWPDSSSPTSRKPGSDRQPG